MISHHAIECLLQRVLLDDASTPVPLLWLGAHEPWWCWDGSSERRLLVSAVRLRDRMSTGKRLRHGAVAKGVMRAPWSEVRTAIETRGHELDLDLVDLAAWRDDFAPGGLMNSQAFAERWRVRQLARLCATIADAVDSTRNPEPMIYETHQIEMFTGEPHGAHP